MRNLGSEDLLRPEIRGFKVGGLPVESCIGNLVKSFHLIIKPPKELQANLGSVFPNKDIYAELGS